MSQWTTRALLLSVLLAAIAATCINDCSNHGDCELGVCHCEEGWEGEDCSSYDCQTHPDQCKFQGQCRDKKCVCHAGFGGYDCSFSTTNCPDFCKGHGECLDGICTCDRGYTGSDCGSVDPTVSCPDNCSGHGFCLITADSQTCHCLNSFWSGDACEIFSSRCPVELNNCTGHGICGPVDLLDKDSAWTCECEPGFCGANCNTACPSCPQNCSARGQCINGACRCDEGFSGADCTVVTAVPTCLNFCSGQGTCREESGVYSCHCSEGFAGADCSDSIAPCPSTCGHGHCEAGACHCYTGYTGDQCDTVIPDCSAHNNCSANGHCENGVCKCLDGFSGEDCSFACSTGGLGDVGCGADKGHGRCINNTCVCKEGEYEGVGCEIPMHKSTLGSVASSNNPVGIIVLSIVAVASLLLLGGYVFNYTMRGKRGLAAVPGMDAVRSTMKGDDYETAPENRYASNY